MITRSDGVLLQLLKEHPLLLPVYSSGDTAFLVRWLYEFALRVEDIVYVGLRRGRTYVQPQPTRVANIRGQRPYFTLLREDTLPAFATAYAITSVSDAAFDRSGHAGVHALIDELYNESVNGNADSPK